jgi:hypothetical protein
MPPVIPPGLSVATIRRPDGSELRLTMESKRGRARLKLRVWSPEFDGVTLSPAACIVLRPADIPELIRGLQSATEDWPTGPALQRALACVPGHIKE